MKRIQNTCLALIITALCATMSFSQIKLAQTGFNFLSVSSDARSSGIGGAVNSFSGFSGAMSYNPASMAEMPTLLSATFSMNKWIADINYLSASVILSPASGDYGTVGLSVQTVDYGDVEGTMVDRNNPNGYFDTGIINPTALAVGLGYSKMISKQFGLGARIKYAYQPWVKVRFLTILQRMLRQRKIKLMQLPMILERSIRRVLKASHLECL